MSKELESDYLTGLTVYFLLRQPTGNIWNGSSFAAYVSANYSTYPITGTEQATSGFFTGDMPSVVAGIYSVVAKQRIGGSPAETDPSIGWGDIQWDGSNVIPLSGVPITTRINTMVATLLEQDISGTIENAAAVHSLASVILKLTSRFHLNTGGGATADTYKTDGSSKKFSQSITTNSSLVATQELGVGA